MLQKYRQEFTDQQAAVASAGAALGQAVEDEATKALIADFLAQHAVLGQKYAAALAAFEQSQGVDFAAADAMVKGQDRKRTDLCDQVVKALSPRVERLTQQERAQTAMQQRVAAAERASHGGDGRGPSARTDDARRRIRLQRAGAGRASRGGTFDRSAVPQRGHGIEPHSAMGRQ